MKERGYMTYKKDLAQKNGQTDLCTKALIEEGKKTGKECLTGLMDLSLKVNSMIIILKDSENIHGMMANSMKGNGKRTSVTEKEFSPGLMADGILVISKEIKRVDLER